MSGLLGIIATVGYFVAYGILFNIGDSSHVSYKTLQLSFVQLLLQVPAVGLDGFNIIVDVARYVWNVMVMMAIYRQFTTVGYVAHATYSRTLDSFPYHWVLVLLATAVPMLLVFVPENGTETADVCTPAIFKSMPWLCWYTFIWSVDFCLMPLMFLPQLLVCYKLSRENTPLKLNVKLFLLCMIIYAAAVLIIYLSVPEFWEITTPICILTIFLLGLPFCGWSWVCNYFCPRSIQDTSGNTEGDVTTPKKGEGSDSTMVIENYELPTININNPIV